MGWRRRLIGFLPWMLPMSLPSQPLPSVPEDTAHIARAAFWRGNPYVLLCDKLGAVFANADFADLYPKLGQPAYAPWRLALVTLMQFREGLSDRQAADAVRGRIDWKYLLALDLADAGFDFSVLCEFGGRLLQQGATERLLARLLVAAREGGLLKARGRQRTDGTHVLAAVRTLNRLELVGETLRAALNAIAVAAPDWLRGITLPDWHERYHRRVEDMRLPDTPLKREAYAVQVGTASPCWTPWTARARPRTRRHCRRWPCCAACGRGTSSETRQRPMVAAVLANQMVAVCGCGRCRVAA